MDAESAGSFSAVGGFGEGEDAFGRTEPAFDGKVAGFGAAQGFAQEGADAKDHDAQVVDVAAIFLGDG